MPLDSISSLLPRLPRLPRLLTFCLAALLSAGAVAALPELPQGVTLDPVVARDLPRACALLDEPKSRAKMDGLLYKLLWLCGRQNELGGVYSESETREMEAGRVLATDAAVNNPAGDTAATGNSHTQNETAMAYNQNTGTLCSGYNDSYHGITTGTGFTGFSRSTDGGATWTDRGALGVNSGGDPAIVWRKADGNFYFVALHTNGLGVWKSTDDCTTFSFLAMVHTGANDDKELVAVDNNVASPNYGKLYVVWTNFDTSQIAATTSANAGVTWSTPVNLSVSGDDVQGAWPTVAPNGDVYAAWVKWQTFPSGPLDGGAKFSPPSFPGWFSLLNWVALLRRAASSAMTCLISR